VCVWHQADQFCRIALGAPRIAGGRAVVYPDILTLDPPETRQRLRKSPHVLLSARIVLWISHQHANAAHASGERPSYRSGKDSDEPASP
jgi:hypothetical protein